MARFAYLLLVAAALASIQVAHADGYVWKPDYKPDYKPVHKPSPSPAPAFVAGTCKDTGYCFPKPLAASPSCPSGTQALPNDASLCWKGSCPAGSPLSHDEHGKPVCLSCPKGYFPDGSYCRQDCPKGYEFDGHEFCVKQCPKGYTSYEHGSKQYCIENCDRGEVAYANVCINIKKWHSNACTKGCSSHRPTKFPTDVYSIVDSAFAPMLRAFDSITDAAGLNSLADALADDGEDYGSKDVFSAAVYGAVAQKGCKCNAVRERHVQQVERRTCNKKPFIVSPVWTTSPTCPSTCIISADRRSCSCAVAPCPSGLVPCTVGWKQAPICVTPNKIYGVQACTVFTCPAVYAELDKSKACVAPVPAPAPTPGYYQG